MRLRRCLRQLCGNVTRDQCEQAYALEEMVMPGPPFQPGSNTDRPDANYRPARQKSVNPSDPPDDYYAGSEPPLRTLVIRQLRRLVGAIHDSRRK